jgi:DNA polymerase-3 subunit epsilon
MFRWYCYRRKRIITDEFVSLLSHQFIFTFTIQVHGIYPRDTVNAKSFAQVFLKFKKRLKNRVVAHNEF